MSSRDLLLALAIVAALVLLRYGMHWLDSWRAGRAEEREQDRHQP